MNVNKIRKRGWYGHSYEHHLASRGEQIAGKECQKSFDEELVKILKLAGRRLSVKYLATRTGWSWMATAKHLKILYDKGLIQKIPLKSINYWKALPEE